MARHATGSQDAGAVGEQPERRVDAEMLDEVGEEDGVGPIVGVAGVGQDVAVDGLVTPVADLADHVGVGIDADHAIDHRRGDIEELTSAGAELDQHRPALDEREVVAANVGGVSRIEALRRVVPALDVVRGAHGRAPAGRRW
jgi:hypothetical protein